MKLCGKLWKFPRTGWKLRRRRIKTCNQMLALALKHTTYYYYKLEIVTKTWDFKGKKKEREFNGYFRWEWWSGQNGEKKFFYLLCIMYCNIQSQLKEAVEGDENWI